MIIILQIIAFCWALSVGYAVAHILIPYVRVRIADCRWKRLHPGMSISRRRA